MFWFPFDGLPEDCVLYQIPVLPDLTTSKLTQTFLILSLGYGSEIPISDKEEIWAIWPEFLVKTESIKIFSISPEKWPIFLVKS